MSGDSRPSSPGLVAADYTTLFPPDPAPGSPVTGMSSSPSTARGRGGARKVAGQARLDHGAWQNQRRNQIPPGGRRSDVPGGQMSWQHCGEEHPVHRVSGDGDSRPQRPLQHPRRTRDPRRDRCCNAFDRIAPNRAECVRCGRRSPATACDWKVEALFSSIKQIFGRWFGRCHGRRCSAR